MTGRRFAAAWVGLSLFAMGCSSAAPDEVSGETSDGIVTKAGAAAAGPVATVVRTPTTTPTAPPPATPTWLCGYVNKTKLNCADGPLCKDERDMDMVHLVNIALAQPPSPSMKGAFEMVGSEVTLTRSNDKDKTALENIRKRWVDEHAVVYGIPAGEFDGLFFGFVKRLWEVAEPSHTDSSCGSSLPYFRIPFVPGADDQLRGRMAPFFRWSQHEYLPPHQCYRKAPATGVPSESVCEFVDPFWGVTAASVELVTASYPQIAGGVAGQNWIATGAVTVTQDPKYTYDAYGNWVPAQFTVYRQAGVPMKMLAADTGVFDVYFNGTWRGKWTAKVGSCATCTTGTGSKATFYADKLL